MTTALHIAPHPDDESIGAPCTLLHLATGARVVVVACGLGRPGDYHRRRRELSDAVAAGGLELVVRDPPAALGSRDDLAATRRSLTPWLTGLIEEYRADIVISPHLHDVHPAHEAVARAVRDAVVAATRPPVWWSWAIWADLRTPTLLFPCSEELRERAEQMLRCHQGELARNDYLDLVRAAGRLAAIRGVERVLGFGAARLPGVRHAELLTELGRVGGRWHLGRPRVCADLRPPRDGGPDGWGPDVSDLVNEAGRCGT